MDKLKPVTLATLMTIHEKTAHHFNAVAESFLEGHLLSISPIARKVRAEYLKKFRLAPVAETGKVSFYFQNSIFLLPEMHDKGVVYYANHTNPLKKIISENHLVGALDEHRFQSLVGSNKMLHETLHLLFFSELFKEKSYFRFSKKFSTEDEQKWVLKHLCTESAVLGVELLASLVEYKSENLCTTKIHTHQHAQSPEEFETLNELIAKYSRPVVYEKLVKLFVIKNLRPNHSDELGLQLFLDIAADKLFAASELTRLYKIVFLGFVFRRYSNERYLTSLGFFKNYLEWLEHQDVKELTNSATVQEIIALGTGFLKTDK